MSLGAFVGVQLGQIPGNRSERVRHLGWTDSEVLIVVYEHGHVET
jgi:hypothetical protein